MAPTPLNGTGIKVIVDSQIWYARGTADNRLMLFDEKMATVADAGNE